MPGEKVMVSCLECGTTNYFPLEAEGKKVVCGRCKAGLPLPGAVLEPTSGQAAQLFQNSSLPVLADFFSPTFVIVRKGAIRDRVSGAMNEENFALWVASRT